MMKEKLNWLLSGTRTILNHQREIEKVRGETFNIFTILKMDKKETVSHTPFLAELLNPNGSHLMGNVFLKLFLALDPVKSVSNTALVNPEKIQVTENKHIGTVVIEDGKEAGGYIDIYLADNNNRSITIENKIDQKTEQPKQVVRYCNYNRLNNVVFYLTPFGTEPSEKSRAKLECNKDFHLLSYKTDIIKWLKECLKETGDNAILRQSIRQYIILLQKITFSMENEQERDLDILMLNHFEESSHIIANFTKAKGRIAEEARQRVIKMLKEKLDNDFNIYAGDNTDNNFSQIWVKYKAHDNEKCPLFFGLESFSPNTNEEMYVGVFSMAGKATDYCREQFSGEAFWPIYYSLEDENANEGINFFKGDILKKMSQDQEFKKKYVERIVSEVEKFIVLHKVSLLDFLDKSKYT